MSPTLHDVAKAVGVSTRTVSRVVRGEKGYSPETEAKVRKAVRDLGYRPNLMARGLISGRSSTIGVVGGEMTDPFFPEFAASAQSAADRIGLTVLFAATGSDLTRQRTVLDSLISRGVDGAIVFPAPESHDQLTEFMNDGLTMVTIDFPLPGGPVMSVSSDLEHGAVLAVEHLKERGRTRIAFLGWTKSVRRRRETGYRRALGRAGPIIENTDSDGASAEEATVRLLERVPDLDAIFAYNDMMAIGAMRALQQAGLSTPGDVAVVGFDDVSVSSLLCPSLTTIRIDQEAIGTQAVAHLNDAIEGQSPRSTVLPVELIVRESS